MLDVAVMCDVTTLNAVFDTGVMCGNGGKRERVSVGMVCGVYRIIVVDDVGMVC